ncbi:MAG: hypothetical protein AAGI52_11685 [Bacteroidota bacterium]
MRPLLLAFLLTPLAVSAQDKSPGTARTISIFAPGGGHLYAGEPVKGVVLLAGTIGGLAVAANAAPKLNDDFQSRDYYTRHGTALGVGLGIAGAAWLYGVLDSPHAARRANERRVEVSAMPTTSGARVSVRVPL